MTALIILAAGASSRLGQPKQNLIFQNQTLLEKAIETGLTSNCRPVIVITGANSDLIDPQVQHQDLKIIHNAGWTDGVSSSIRMAIRSIESNEMVDSAIIMLCDQPFVSTELIGNLQSKYKETGKPIVACSYNDTVGVPALFRKSLFPQLLILTGDEGAKKIIYANRNDVAKIFFERGSIDIDTLADYQRLIKDESDL